MQSPIQTPTLDSLYKRELEIRFIIYTLNKIKSKHIDIDNQSIKLMDQIISNSYEDYSQENIYLYTACYLFLVDNGLYITEFTDEYINNLINTLQTELSSNGIMYNKLKINNLKG